MRLAQTLAKAVVILAVIAVTLGGAVALGSTLFDPPPRDAAEFAARVEAGSTHAPPPETRTAEERRYVLAVIRLCRERNEDLRDLDREVSSADELVHLRGWRQVWAGYAEAFLALTPPERFQLVASRAAELDRGMLDLSAGALEAREAGDRETYEAKTRATELLRARYNRAMVDLDAPACAANV